MSQFKIVAFSGSLRKKSLNTAALHAAAELVPAGVSVLPVPTSPVKTTNPRCAVTP